MGNIAGLRYGCSGPSSPETGEREWIAHELLRSNEYMQEELRMAAEFQRAVLPEVVDVPYLRTCLLYRPLHGVSGDVYDFILNREKELSVFLGDATGHGIAAALMTMMVLLGLDSMRPNLPTDQSMRRLNQLIAARETGRAVSGLLFRISPRGTLSVTHAGHPSLIIIPANGSGLRQFHGGGCALGLFEDEPVPYQEEYFKLDRGDKLFAYTDGIIEWRNRDNEIFGSARLLQFLKQQRQKKIEEIAGLLVETLDRYAQGVPCHDDLTALIFEYSGDEAA
ncbi:MAG: PP2C family protein-serine/threonine phosphatase [Gammaproteobacteria bacterium]